MNIKTALLTACAVAGLLAGCESDDPCQIALLRHLKAPMTAKVSMTFDNPAESASLQAAFPTVSSRETGGWVDAQNPMGVYLRTGWICEAKQDGHLTRIAFVDHPAGRLGRIYDDHLPEWGPWETR